MLPAATYSCGMGGRAEPPEGTPEGGSGGEEEFRSVVFDESFIRAARIQELSAQERMSSGTRPINRRGLRGGGLPRQALALMLLVSLAFAAAVYMGTRHPYPEAATTSVPLVMNIYPLEPGTGGIPTVSPSPSPSASLGPSASAGASSAAGSAGATASSTAGGTPSPSATAGTTGSAGSPSATASASPSASATSDAWPFAGTALYDDSMMAIGKAGLSLPQPHHTADFSKSQVLSALSIVAQYLDVSSLTPAVLTGGNTSTVRAFLAPGQYAQFDQSVSSPVDDQQHDTTGWMVRFDGKQVQLASTDVLTGGSINFSESGSGRLGVTSDHTFVYALTPVPSATGTAQQQPIILYTVRRVVHYEFTAADINANQVEITRSTVEAGPMACGSDNSRYLQPLFPTAPVSTAASTAKAKTHTPTPTPAPSSTTGTGVNPYDHHTPAWDVCGVLATGSTP